MVLTITSHSKGNLRLMPKADEPLAQKAHPPPVEKFQLEHPQLPPPLTLHGGQENWVEDIA